MQTKRISHIQKCCLIAKFGGKTVGSKCLSIFVKLFHTYLPKSPLQSVPFSVSHKAIAK